MREQRIRQELRVLSREQVLSRARSGTLSWTQAAALLGVTPRQLRRIRHRYEELGADGLKDGRVGGSRRRRVSMSEQEISFLVGLKKGKYQSFTVRHFWEIATDKYGCTASYSWLLRTLQARGVVKKLPHKGTYRRRRPRQPMVGMRVHTDGSTHRWFGEAYPYCDLCILLDDADGRILSAALFEQEGVLSTFALLREALDKYGRFGELYHDRCTAYCVTTDKTQGPDDQQSGQVPRALKTLSIKQRWAYSPQARGRCERAFRTLQDRLCAELQDERITNIQVANAYLRDVFIPRFNQRFTVKPESEDSAFCTLPMHPESLDLVLSVQEERVVKNDYTLSWHANTLQLPKPTDGRVRPKQKVTVHHLPSGVLAVTHHQKLLAYFQAELPWKRAENHRVVHKPIALPPTKTPDPYLGRFPKIADLKGPVLSRNDLFDPQWGQTNLTTGTGHL